MCIRDSVRGLISAGLASARAVAAKEQRYAGIRFQKAYNPDDPEQLKASQYMVFIVHDPDPPPYGTDLANGFRAVEGLKPIKLPDAIGVMDSTLIRENIIDPFWEPSGLAELNDLTTFSIIFSPSGKMIIHDVRVRNRDGYVDSAVDTNISSDGVFNKKVQVDSEVGMFYQDDYFGAFWSSYPDLGLGPEPARNSFIIYDRKEFRQAYEKSRGYSDCLVRLVPIYINPYTGTMISAD